MRKIDRLKRDVDKLINARKGNPRAVEYLEYYFMTHTEEEPIEIEGYPKPQHREELPPEPEGYREWLEEEIEIEDKHLDESTRLMYEELERIVKEADAEGIA